MMPLRPLVAEDGRDLRAFEPLENNRQARRHEAAVRRKAQERALEALSKENAALRAQLAATNGKTA